MNWRIDIKEFFKSGISEIEDFVKFDYWNSQNTQYTEGDSYDTPAVLFEYSDIGSGAYFANVQNVQSANTKAVDVRLHILLNNFNYLEEAQDEVFRLAKLIVDKFSGLRIPEACTWTRMEITDEIQDINHDSLIEYEIVFSFLVLEVVEVPEDKKADDIKGDIPALIDFRIEPKIKH